MLRTSLIEKTVVALCVCLPVLAQDSGPEPSPEERVDEVFSRWDTTTGPGCAVSVVENGEIVYKQAYGMANLDHDVPIRADTIFHVASVSKEFTAAAIALLAMEGRLSLDDPVRKHLPWVPDFGHTITIRNLIHHNSGIRDQWALLEMTGWRYSRDRITDDDVIYLIKRQRDLNFLPGERYLYSNSGYTLMSQIVQAVSGQSLREFTSGRIFEPLGMTRTHFRDDFSEIVKGQAFGYRWDDEASAFRLSVTNFDTVGATSLLTTVEDMARWDRNFIDAAVGGKELLDLIHEPGRLNSGKEQDYAFGLVHGAYRGLRTVGHGGSDAGYRVHFVRFPDQGYSFVVLCNLAQTNPARLTRELADIYLEGHLDPADSEEPATMNPVALTDEEVSHIEGVYWSDGFASVLRVDRRENSVQLSFAGQEFEMIHTGNGLFSVPTVDLLLRFEPAAQGAQRALFWFADDPSSIEEADRVPPIELSEGSLGEFAGEYQSPELAVTYHIDLNQGQLIIHWLKRDPSKLTPLAEDLLTADGVGALRFQRDASGQVTGFTLDSGRVRNFRFERAR